MKIKNNKISLLHFDKFGIIGLLISSLGTLANLVVPPAVKQSIDFKSFILGNHVKMFLLIIILLLGAACLTAISDFLLSRNGDRYITQLRINIQEHLLSMPTSFFDKNISSQLASRVINDSSFIRTYMTTVIPQTVSGIIGIVGTIIILVALDVKLALLTLVSFPMLAIVAGPLGKINERISNEIQTKVSDVTGISTESLRNIRTIKLNGAEEKQIQKFKKHMHILYKLSVKLDGVYAIISPIISSLSVAVILLILFYGGIRVKDNTLSLGTLVSFIIYFFQMNSSVNSVLGFYSSYKQAQGATYQINKILKTQTENSKLTTTSDIDVNRSDLVLVNTTFSYDKTAVLKNIVRNIDPAEHKG